MPTSSLIKTIKPYPAKRGSNKRAFVLCGFGGSIWQMRRLIDVLRRAGYHVTAMDFSETVLSQGDPLLLPRLIDEVVAYSDRESRMRTEPILLVGVSLGALIALNILRRSPHFHESVMLTGGDIVRVAQRIYGRRIWPHSYEELAHRWQDINMYSAPKKLTGKRLLFVLPANDRLIDTEDVRREVHVQNEAGNHVILVERRPFGHIGTIIEEAILFPKRTLRYITRVSK